jgi:hypothetical protein
LTWKAQLGAAQAKTTGGRMADVEKLADRPR